jgi:hypothetical protein
MKPIQLIASLFTLTAFVLTGCGGGSSSSGGGPDVEASMIKAAKLLIEHNATDEDTGFQGFADGDPWNSLTITDPNGDPILTATPDGGLLDFGLTEFFFETSEPENAQVPIEDVLARLSEGQYDMTGLLVDAGDSSMKTPFSHAIPKGPLLLTPADESTDVDPGSAVVTWQPVTKTIDDASASIVGYQVIVEEAGEPQFPQGFARALFSVHLPASATRVSIPESFFKADGCYKYEVLAIESSGNQTLSSATFETGTGCTGEDPPEDHTPALKAAKLLIEHNATDEDTGFQGFADGDPWNELVISNPDGEQILTIHPETGLFDFGLTELFFETSEPPNAEVPISEVLARLPEGTYTFSGDMVDGDESEITAIFSHAIPAGPQLLSPEDGSTEVDAGNTVISWQPVTRDINGSAVTIVGYQVIVKKDEEPQYPEGFAQSLFSIHLPATATSITVPSEFMESGEAYTYEVLAIETSGNQTLSLAAFETQ